MNVSKSFNYTCSHKLNFIVAMVSSFWTFLLKITNSEIHHKIVCFLVIKLLKYPHYKLRFYFLRHFIFFHYLFFCHLHHILVISILNFYRVQNPRGFLFNFPNDSVSSSVQFLDEFVIFNSFSLWLFFFLCLWNNGHISSHRIRFLNCDHLATVFTCFELTW